MVFIAHMYRNGLSHSTVNCYISGLSFYSKINNIEDFTQMFIVRKMIVGMKRTRSKCDTQLPITRELLKKIMAILPSICSNSYEAKLFKAAFSLAFYGFFRVGEVTVCKMDKQSHTNKVGNVKLSSDNIEIFLSLSKTDQFGKGTTICISEQKVKAYCPVNNLGAFLQSRPSGDGPLFCHFDMKPLTRYQFSSVLKKSLSVSGVPNSRFTSHSFRIGMATSCAMEGMPDEQIMKLGRWKSEAYMRYIRIPS